VGSGGRASALLLWGRPGGAAGGRGAGCRLERAVRLSRRSASTTVTGPWPPAGQLRHARRRPGDEERSL